MSSLPAAFLLSVMADSTPCDAPMPAWTETATSAFDRFLEVPFEVADGFSSPQRAGRSAVNAVGAGRVVFAGRCGAIGGLVVVNHVFYVNHEKTRRQSAYSGLSTVLAELGAEVHRGQRLGVAAEGFRWSLRSNLSSAPSALGSAEDAKALLLEHARLFVPQKESTLILVDQARNKMRIISDHRGPTEFEVGFGQSAGRKRQRGDNRTPRGMYFVAHKKRGEFPGPYGAYFGGHWIRINYPNRFDAAHGFENGLIDRKQRDSISRAWRARRLTLQKTRIGSGIGFHGWAGAWRASDGTGLSWGCIVMHDEDIRSIFDQIQPKTMVILM